jgi:TonB family protein
LDGELRMSSRWLCFFSSSPSWGESPLTQREWVTRVQDLLLRNLAPSTTIKDLDTDQLVRLRVTVLRDGSVRNVTVERSSGHRQVDQAAIAMVNGTGGSPRSRPA